MHAIQSARAAQPMRNWPTMACQAVCQQLCLPTLAFKATAFCQLLEGAIALPDLLLAAAAGPGLLCCDIGNALDALARGIGRLPRHARPARF
eukprot:100121-Chlamydomonas_euryale.AAC.3